MVKGGYFLPMDEELQNRQLVNNTIQRIIKARGPSYGGQMYDDMEMYSDDDEGGCMNCPMGSGMNRKAYAYKEYLKKKKMRDTAANWNKFKKTKAYKPGKKMAKKPKAYKPSKKMAKKPKAVNPWLEFVAKYRAKNPGMAYKDVLKAASSVYKKKKGGYLE